MISSLHSDVLPALQRLASLALILQYIKEVPTAACSFLPSPSFTKVIALFLQTLTCSVNGGRGSFHPSASLPFTELVALCESITRTFLNGGERHIKGRLATRTSSVLELQNLAPLAPAVQHCEVDLSSLQFYIKKQSAGQEKTGKHVLPIFK